MGSCDVEEGSLAVWTGKPLATVTPVMLPVIAGVWRPSAEQVRDAVYGWICVKPLRMSGEAPPNHLSPTLRHLEEHTLTLSVFAVPDIGPELTRSALNALMLRMDGQRAAPTTAARKRAVFYNVLGYGVETGGLDFNPIDKVAKRREKQSAAIDPRLVISLDQGMRLLAAVREQGPMGARLEAFFAVQMFAALRPAEALSLQEANLIDLPEDQEAWGDMLLTRSMPRSGQAWSDSGRSRERRSLKHRAANETRPVPIHPELVKVLRRHLDQFGTGPSGQLFIGPRGGTPDESTYLRIWDDARKAALSAREYASPLAKRPYDLRHFAISFWLAAGLAVALVAQWAGNSPAVIWAVYAKVINGMNEEARRMIGDATARALAARITKPAAHQA